MSTATRVGVVGTGLIGTSIGLALSRAGQEVLLVDADPARAAAAAALGAGSAGTADELRGCRHVVVAVPPAATAGVVTDVERLAPNSTISDVASVKANVLAEVESQMADPSRFCGGHPIAGRERGGPGAARPTLFEGAVWAVVPIAASSQRAIDDVAGLAEWCGARVVRLSPAEHDVVLAAVSHVPQLVASLLAAELRHAGTLAPALAGSGFRDTTRLADSDPDLWAGIATANGAAVAPVLDRLADRLTRLAVALRSGGPDARGAVHDVVAAGNAGRALLPGKHSTRRPAWAHVGVVLPDRPGELGRLLTAAGDEGVNVEDLTIEHAAEHPAGHVDLEVRPELADVLVAALRRRGWAAHRDD